MGIKRNAITTYPKTKPMTVCMYDIERASTQPGTLMKVMPEMDVPIIPIAIRYHGDWRFAMKKELLSEAPRLVTKAMPMSIKK